MGTYAKKKKKVVGFNYSDADLSKDIEKHTKKSEENIRSRNIGGEVGVFTDIMKIKADDLPDVQKKRKQSGTYMKKKKKGK